MRLGLLLDSIFLLPFPGRKELGIFSVKEIGDFFR
jgi:hypothetical protein